MKSGRFAGQKVLSGGICLNDRAIWENVTLPDREGIMNNVPILLVENNKGGILSLTIRAFRRGNWPPNRRKIDVTEP